jgi:hypothetical protein
LTHEPKYYTEFSDIYNNIWKVQITQKGLLIWSPREHNFGIRDTPTIRTFKLINLTGEDITVDVLIASGADQFEIVNLYDLNDIFISAGGSIDVIVEFDGNVPGAYTGILRAIYNGLNFDANLVGIWTVEDVYDIGS